MHVGLQVAILYAATKGYLDAIEVNQVLDFERGLADHLNAKNSSLLAKIEQRAKLADVEDELKKSIEEFAKGFRANA